MDTIGSLGYFTGINNVDDAVRLAPMTVKLESAYKTAYQLTQANNVDIDNTYKIASRAGRTLLASAVDGHSLWSDGKACFYVDGTTFYQVMADFTTVVIRNVTPGLRMSYVVINDRVYYTNGAEFGFVKGMSNYASVNPGIEFKEPLPAGKFIDVFMGCIYMAVKNILYVSDPLCDYYDVRTGYRMFADDITMVRAVDLGIYVSDKKIWWLKGFANEDFERQDAYPEPAIPYTDIKFPSEWMGGKGGDVAVWTGLDGICVGDNNGDVNNLTREKYVMPQRSRGTAYLRDNNGVKHYVNSLY